MAVLGASSLQINSATLGSQSGSAPMHTARAWVRYNGSTAAIAGNGNVSGVSRTGVGLYTISFSTNMPDTTYSVAGSAKSTDDGSNASGERLVAAFYNFTNGTVKQVVTTVSTSAGVDATFYVSAIVVR